MDETLRQSFLIYTAVIGRSMCFGANILLLVGLILFGLATWRGSGSEKAASSFMFLYFITLLVYTVSRFGGLNDIYQVARYFYLFIPPLCLLLIGVWLWRGQREVTV